VHRITARLEWVADTPETISICTCEAYGVSRDSTTKLASPTPAAASNFPSTRFDGGPSGEVDVVGEAGSARMTRVPVEAFGQSLPTKPMGGKYFLKFSRAGARQKVS
jgi:hypothetical protein